MNKETETKLIECHILMVEALKGYEDRAFQSNKLFELRQYSNQLPDEMNKKMINNSEVQFGIHEGTNRVTIKIIDRDTKKVIKELPPEKTLDMIAKAWEMAGILVDEKR